MNTKKRIILGFLIFILLAVVIFISCGLWNYMRQKNELKESLKSFSTILESGNLDSLNLTIYYGPTYDTPFPWNVDYLIRNREPTIVVDGTSLKEHIDLLKQLSDVNLVPIWKKSYLDARIYYVFETEENGKIFDVAMWGSDGKTLSIFFNGIEIKSNNVFYYVLMTFLSEDELENRGGLKDYLNKEN